VLVTQSALDRYARWAELEREPERARKELTRLLLDAYLVEGGATGATARYRRRNRASDLDITARVVVEDRLAVVVSIEVREYSGYRREQ
jgi:hypothetical protein